MSEPRHHLKKAFWAILPLFVIGVAVSLAFVSVAWASDLTSSSVIDHINRSRQESGLVLLVENEKLTRAATAKAEDMIKNDYFAHTSPAGVDPWHWLGEADYQYKTAGENLAVNFIDTGVQHESWMNSTTHRANIMNPEYEEVGVAVVEGNISGKETLVTVSLYARPAVAIASKGIAVPPNQIGAVQGVNTETILMAPTDISPASGTSPFFQVSFLSAFLMTALAILSGSLTFLVRAYRVLERMKKPLPQTAAALL